MAQNQLSADRGNARDHAFAKIAFHLVFLGIAHAAMGQHGGFCCGETETIKGLVEQGMIPLAWAKLGPDDTVPALIYPHVINIVVCGDRTRNKTQALHAAYVKPVTKEIKLPKNWNALKKNRA